MKIFRAFLLIFLEGLIFTSMSVAQIPQALPKTAVPSTPLVRGLKDTVGFAISAPQMDLTVRLSRKADAQKLEANAEKYNLKPGHFFIAGISPHDDFIYAGPVYAHLYPYLQAKRVVIFGVSHYARRYHVENTLVFDDFKKWRSPYGLVPVSSLREEILAKLPKADYIVSSPMQAEEHSVEALVPWLQYYNRDVEIVSILVPYMGWNKLEGLASDLSGVLAQLIQAHHWKLGTDIAFLISNDCSHYGDQGWGGRNFAPFGVGCKGLKKGTARDRKIAQETLCSRLTSDKVHDFYNRVLDPKDYYKYKVTWCGRFAVPFGTTTLVHLMKELHHKPLTGMFLRYGDSVELGELDVRHTGMGVTAPANLHHWVGYVAIGYR
ncbi:MAG: AmmeMemoRadiSam system protein B [Calditrichaeota bacterium]|nr:AmmeMemoRadiSam system protein B [Calditrichota bacterium]